MEYKNLTYSNRNRKNGGSGVWVYLQKLVLRRAENLVCRIHKNVSGKKCDRSQRTIYCIPTQTSISSAARGSCRPLTIPTRHGLEPRFSSGTTSSKLERKENSVQSWHHRLLLFRSLNHLVRPPQHLLRNRQTDLLRRLEIDHQLKLRRLLHR